MNKSCSSRWVYFAEFLVIVGLLSFAHYLEWYQGQAPCLLCEAQRFVFAALGGLFFISLILPQRRIAQLLPSLLQILTALCGLILASRQVLLQYFPGLVTEGNCDASLEYLLQVMPLSQLMGTILLGGPECAKIDWQFLHLSIASWSLLWFGFFSLLSLWQFVSWLFGKGRR